MDVTSDMYPGLIDGLVEHYGPAGLDHPDYAKIAGHPASTPTLDALASEGMRFSNVWAQPFCSATRASIITGLFAAETKVASYADPLSQNHTTFVSQLKTQGGYRTAIFGKWHLAGLPGPQESYPGMKPKQAGFDLFRGNLHAAIDTYWDYDYQVQDAATPAGEWRSEKPPKKSLPGIAPTTFAPVVKVADAIEWIEAQEAENADRPWFTWLAFNLSHATIQRDPSQMVVPNADTLNDETRQEIEQCGGRFGSANVGSCSGETLMRGMTNAMDTVVGKLLDVVEEADPNTYVIYVSDNGTPMYGRPGLDFIDNMYITRSGRGKGTAYESGARVALAIRGPGIEAGSESREFAHVADLYSTILELAGLGATGRVSNSAGTDTIPLQARSLGPILFGNSETVRDPNDGYVLTETLNLMSNNTRQVGARNATHKVVCTDGVGVEECEFYDLANDPLEEYPLEKPANCVNDAYGRSTPADSQWHFCRLIDVVAAESFLRD